MPQYLRLKPFSLPTKRALAATRKCLSEQVPGLLQRRNRSGVVVSRAVIMHLEPEPGRWKESRRATMAMFHIFILGLCFLDFGLCFLCNGLCCFFFLRDILRSD